MAYQVVLGSRLMPERRSNMTVPRQACQLGTGRAAGFNSVSLVLPFAWTTFDLICVGPPFTYASLPSPFLEQMLN